MSFIQEFKSFAMRGNVVDMAVGVVIGAAFGKIVSSLVAHIVTPAIGLIVGGVKFDHLKLVLKEAESEAAAVSIDYGLFLQSVFDFVIVAFAIFSVVKLMNGLKRKEEAAPVAAPATPPADIALLTEIRDLLRK